MSDDLDPCPHCGSDYVIAVAEGQYECLGCCGTWED